MQDLINFYVDDSGARRPDHDFEKLQQDVSCSNNVKWFSLGGVLVNEEDEETLRKLHSEFLTLWNIKSYLRSYDIRNGKNGFEWLGGLSDKERNSFMSSLTDFLMEIPAIGLACVVDRVGYHKRYIPRYGRTTWHLCKTAFNIVVERCVKYAVLHDKKVRILIEKTNKRDDEMIVDYVKELKTNGQPFSKDTSNKYNPLTHTDFKDIIYDIKFKNKSSPPMQVADLYLWPICHGGYDSTHKAYKCLKSHGKLIEQVVSLECVSEIKTKYSCFDR